MENENGNLTMPSKISASTSSQFLALVLDRMAESNIIAAELARRLNCTDQNVALLLQPGRDYKLSTVEKIAAALDFRFSLSELESGSTSTSEKVRVGRKKKRGGIGQRRGYA